MIVRQIVDVPADHRLTIQVPWEITTARVILTITPEPAKETDTIRLPGIDAETVEEAIQLAKERAADPNRKPISRHFGKHPGFFGGDGVAYQRAIRDEWD